MEWRLSQTAQGNIKSVLLILCLAVASYLIFTPGKYQPITPIAIYTSSYLALRWIGLCKIEVKYVKYSFFNSLFQAAVAIYGFHILGIDNYPLLNFLYFSLGIGLLIPLSLEFSLGFYQRRG